MIFIYEQMMTDWLLQMIKEAKIEDFQENKDDFEPEFREDLKENKNDYYILRHDYC